MSATDTLWPLLFPSYKIYYVDFMCFYHLLKDVVMARVGENKQSPHFHLRLCFGVARKYDALCMLTTQHSISHFTASLWKDMPQGDFKFIGFIKVFVWCRTLSLSSYFTCNITWDCDLWIGDVNRGKWGNLRRIEMPEMLYGIFRSMLSTSLKFLLLLLLPARWNIAVKTANWSIKINLI